MEAAAAAEEHAELPSDVANSEFTTFTEALALASGAKPLDSAASGKKIAYATKLSGYFAKVIKNGLKSQHPRLFAGVRAGEEPVGTSHESKKIDVLLATDRIGLALDVSIKTQSFPGVEGGKVKPTKAFCHNITRIIDQELSVEAKRAHTLFPHAVLVAVIFFPPEACNDANPLWKDPDKRRDSHCSSIAEFAQRLRKIAGRDDVRHPDQESHLEAAYIAVYGLAKDGVTKDPAAEPVFFNVQTPVRRSGLPDKLLSFQQWLDELASLYRQRFDPKREWVD